MKTQSYVMCTVIICIVCFSPINAVGEGIYETLRGFMGEIGNVMNDVVAGIEKVNKGIKSVEDFLDATVDEDCYFECPPGKIAKPKQGHIPVSNGCGSLGLEEYLNTLDVDALPMTQFKECCDIHDICYETCGNDKDECDLKFKKCLYRHCSSMKETATKLKHKACQAGAKILYSGTTIMGCKPYINAQEESCTCSPIKDEF